MGLPGKGTGGPVPAIRSGCGVGGVAGIRNGCMHARTQHRKSRGSVKCKTLRPMPRADTVETRTSD